MRGTYKVNINKFDVIDTEEKAYWIGFIWCDGYNAKRKRKDVTTYEFKLSLKDSDVGHLEKFKNFMESDHPIKIYKAGGNYAENLKECRFLLANTEFGKKLDEQYGLIANRSDVSKLISSIPDNLFRHFVRGVLDADGSFTKYKTTEKGREVTKYIIGFTSYIQLLKHINCRIAELGISNSKINKYGQRHVGGDGECRELKYSGRLNCKRILDWLYADSNIYLERKYEKYINMYK